MAYINNVELNIPKIIYPLEGIPTQILYKIKGYSAYYSTKETITIKYLYTGETLGIYEYEEKWKLGTKEFNRNINPLLWQSPNSTMVVMLKVELYNAESGDLIENYNASNFTSPSIEEDEDYTVVNKNVFITAINAPLIASPGDQIPVNIEFVIDHNVGGGELELLLEGSGGKSYKFNVPGSNQMPKIYHHSFTYIKSPNAQDTLEICANLISKYGGVTVTDCKTIVVESPSFTLGTLPITPFIPEPVTIFEFDLEEGKSKMGIWWILALAAGAYMTFKIVKK